MKYYRITKKDLFDLFGRLANTYRVIVPYLANDRFHFGDFDASKEDKIELGGIRQTQPLKSFINPVREGIQEGESRDMRPLIVAGVKGCDLSSLVLQDFVFLEGGPEDPRYSVNRKKTLLIGCDCTFAAETCFCMAMEGAPYPRKYFDLSLSASDDGFIVETGSARGEALINDFKMFFAGISESEAASRQAPRNKVRAEIERHIAKRGTVPVSHLAGAMKRNFSNTALWQDFASTCVECGACNLACPTCHCFLLFDDSSKENFKRRYRVWDACLYKTFARVAGGANPRKHLYERLRNRFDKKFDFFPQVLQYYACTGCGRCIEACPGDIDLREVLKGLVNGKWNKPPND